LLELGLPLRDRFQGILDFPPALFRRHIHIISRLIGAAPCYDAI
jgi:hypothetical protein